MSQEINEINNILKKVIVEIHDGKDKIFNITESIRDDYDKQVLELEEIKSTLEIIINEVDKYDKLDKKMRLKLVNVSSNFSNSDQDVKSVYEEALNIRVKHITLIKEEKELRNRRDKLELSLRMNLQNIEQANSVIQQVNVALYYLSGDLESKINEIEDENKMTLGLKILEAQENERSRIAREVHDGPAQYLANTIMRMDLCKKLMEKDTVQVIYELEDLKNNMKKALKEVRGIIYDLRPPFLENLTLAESVQDLIDSFREESSINIRSNIIPSQFSSDTLIEVGVYRIVQELLNNIKKHSKADEAFLSLEISKDWIYINIQDNGIGFIVEEIMKNTTRENSSYGISGIYDRVTQLGGKLNLKTGHTMGTKYLIKIPTTRGR